jgi:formylglycine-generating enzyme required for sulfatase activity
MRSSLAAATLLLILGMFFFQTSYSSAQQPNKESFTNSIGIKFMLIPKGKFLMGSPPDEKGSVEAEVRHEVTISHDYYLGTYEVTQAQYKQIMGRNPSMLQQVDVVERHPETNRVLRVVKGPDRSNHPVEQVSWEDAAEFCQLLSALPEEKKAGRVYRLPSEAEWEYACRAGSQTAYSFGRDAKSLINYGWYNSTGDTLFASSHAVGLKKANAWGLYDMHGNVWEWCSDWKGDYPTGSVTDPIGPATGKYRVNRGGSFINNSADCRCANRYYYGPLDRNCHVGFRVALSSVEEATVRQDHSSFDKVIVRQNPKEITNSIGIKLVRIPKGKFLMGSPEVEYGLVYSETLHEVTISNNFHMGSTEVTQAQWQKLMGNKPSKFDGDELPVEQINWEEAVEFCKRLSERPEEKKAGRKYRLPTEAEWEYACRAGTSTPFHFGSRLSGRQANCNGAMPYGDDKQGPHLKNTTPVGKYPGNAWGLYDMHGNVWEWCSDWAGEYPPESFVTDPSGPATGSYRVNRGGSYGMSAVLCRSAFRNRFVPSLRSSLIGFRVVMTLSENPK